MGRHRAQSEESKDAGKGVRVISRKWAGGGGAPRRARLRTSDLRPERGLPSVEPVAAILLLLFEVQSALLLGPSALPTGAAAAAGAKAIHSAFQKKKKVGR